MFGVFRFSPLPEHVILWFAVQRIDKHLMGTHVLCLKTI